MLTVQCTELVAKAGIRGVAVEGGQAAVTIRDGGVLLYGLKHQQCVGNWVVPPGNHKTALTAGSALLARPPRLVVVRNQQKLCGSPSDDDTQQLGASWVMTAPAPVERLAPIGLDGLFLVVMQDAQVCLADGSADGQLGPVLRAASGPEPVEVLDVLPEPGRARIVLLLHGQPGYWLCCLQMDELELRVVGTLELAPPPSHSHASATLMAVASCAEVGPGCAVAWSSGHLCRYSAPPPPQWNGLDSLSWDYAVPVSLASHVAMAFVQSEALVTFGVLEQSATGAATLADARVWHTMFGTLYAAATADQFADLSEPVTAQPVGGHLLVQSAGNVWQCNVLQLPLLSFATAVGAHRQPNDRASASFAPKKLDSLMFGAAKSKAESWTDAAIHKAVEAISGASEAELVKRTDKFLGMPGPVPGQLVHLICGRCCGSSAPVRAPGALHALLDRGLVSGRLHPEVLPRCIETGATELVLLCLDRVADIPELELVGCLSLGLEQEPELADKLLLGVVQANSSRKPLLAAVRTLPVEQVVRMLGWLHEQLEEHCMGALGDQLLNWVAVMLDGHFHELLFCDEAQQILGQCSELVNEQAQLCVQLSELEPLRWLAEQTIKVPLQQVPDYSICYLDI